MKNKNTTTLSAALLIVIAASAQSKPGTVTQRPVQRTITVTRQPTVQNPSTVNPAVPVNVTQNGQSTQASRDKNDQFEIAGLGATVFTASNEYDGSPTSYNQTQYIRVTLIPSTAGSSNFQLIFYSPSQKIAQAAFYDQGVLNIYYPISMYHDIKEKFSQSQADRSKIYVTVIQRADGHREGSLSF